MDMKPSLIDTINTKDMQFLFIDTFSAKDMQSSFTETTPRTCNLHS